MTDFSQNYMSSLSPATMASAYGQMQNIANSINQQRDYQQAGSLMAGGDIDAGVQALQRSGQLDEARAIQQHVATMDIQQRAKMKDLNDQVARAAILAKNPEDWSTLVKSLKSYGIDTSSYENMPFDQARNLALTHSDLLNTYIDQHNREDDRQQKLAQAAQVAQQQAMTNQINLGKENVPLKDASGNVVTYNKATGQFAQPVTPPAGVDTSSIFTSGDDEKSDAEGRAIKATMADHPGMTYTEASDFRRNNHAASMAGLSLAPRKDDNGQLVRDENGMLDYIKKPIGGSVADIRQQKLDIAQHMADPQFAQQLSYARSSGTQGGKQDIQNLGRSTQAVGIMQHLGQAVDILQMPNANQALGVLRSNTNYQNLWNSLTQDNYWKPGQDAAERRHQLVADMEKEAQTAPVIARDLGQILKTVAFEADRLFTAGQGQVPEATRAEIRPIIENIGNSRSAGEAAEHIKTFQNLMAAIALPPSVMDIQNNPVLRDARLGKTTKLIDFISKYNLNNNGLIYDEKTAPTTQQNAGDGGGGAAKRPHEMSDDELRRAMGM